jgi:hypothetical protein
MGGHLYCRKRCFISDPAAISFMAQFPVPDRLDSTWNHHYNPHIMITTSNVSQWLIMLIIIPLLPILKWVQVYTSYNHVPVSVLKRPIKILQSWDTQNGTYLVFGVFKLPIFTLPMNTRGIPLIAPQLETICVILTILVIKIQFLLPLLSFYQLQAITLLSNQQYFLQRGTLHKYQKFLKQLIRQWEKSTC